MSASGVVLAAGSGSRLGRPKAELIVGGARLVDRAVAVLRGGGCDQVVAVVRIGTVVDADTVVVNPDPARGMGSSLALGLAAAIGDVAAVLLVDTPGVGSDAVRRVLASPGQVRIATYSDRRGHPVAFTRVHFAEVARLAHGDEGARPFLLAHPELVVEVPCDGDPADVDTVEDLVRWDRLQDRR